MKKSRFPFIFIFCLIIMSCSKEDPQQIADSSQNLSVKTGVFVDSAVEGLYYETETKRGYTNVKGEFEYLEGEVVTFFLGDIKLGKSKAGPILSPISIASSPKATVYTKEVQYMAALLQTLDIDGDPGNGIKLIPEVVNAIADVDLNLKQPDRDMFLGIVKKVKERTGIELNEKFPEQAASHLAETLGENFELYSSLIPVLESSVTPFEPLTSVTWEHQVNDEGKLVKSIRFENYPYRISAEYNYTEYLEDGYPLVFEITNYKLGEPEYTISKEILYTEEREAIGFKNFNFDGEINTISSFDGINADGHIVEQKVFDRLGLFLYRETFERDEKGNVLIHSRYSSETSTDIEDLEIRYEFTHNEAGELLLSKQLRPYIRNLKSDYYYRDDNTLRQKNTIILVLDQNRMYSREDFYDQQEKLYAFNIIQGDWRSEYLELYPDGDPKLVYTYYQDWLQEIAIFDEEGYGELTIQHLDRSGSYQIDYRDPNYNLIKIEFFDDDGNYERTEYYENNELVNTEYIQ